MNARAVVPWYLRAAVFFVGIWPFAALSFFGALIGFFAGTVLRIRRRHVVSAMARAGVANEASAMYRGLGASLLELVWMSARRATMPSIDIVGRERFEAAKTLGKGVIVVTAHMGNWDLVACACAKETELSVVTRRLSMRGLDALWQTTRSARGVSLIAAPDGGVLAKAKETLARGHAVAILVDQDPERTHGVVFAPFLGEMAAHDVLPATLSARTGAPIVLAIGSRRHGQRVELVETWTPPARASRAWIEATTKAIAARVEDAIRAAPREWLWMHRRWKTRPP